MESVQQGGGRKPLKPRWECFKQILVPRLGIGPDGDISQKDEPGIRRALVFHDPELALPKIPFQGADNLAFVRELDRLNLIQDHGVETRDDPC